MLLLRRFLNFLNQDKVRKVLIICYGILVVAICLLLVFLNIEDFKLITQRFKEIFDVETLKCFFENYNSNNTVVQDEIIEEAGNFVDSVIEKIESTDKSFWDIIFDSILNGFDFLLDFIIYFGNFGINILFILYIYFHEVFTSEHLEIKKSILATFHMYIKSKIKQFYNKIISLLASLLCFIRRKKKIILITTLCILIANSTIYRILVELIIFVVVYIYKAILLESYLLIFEILKSVILFIYPYLKDIPRPILYLMIIILLFIKAIQRAEYRLFINHQRLKEFAKDEITQTTFINGPPGTGKTLLNVSLSLASEENFIEEFESKLLEYEINYPDINFANVRNRPEDYPEHAEYIANYRHLLNRGTFIISNYALYSPYFNEFSKIFDFNFMRKNKQTNVYALEEYNIISISELDKEYNSHDDKKQVGEDGAATFFSTVSHDLKRKVKIFCDYQLKDQVPLRIRGNSEYIYTISERQKKYPFLLGIYYLPVKLFSKLLRRAITKYEQKKVYITRKTKRKSYARYKRNDYNFIYAIIRDLALLTNKICAFFDKYWFFRIRGYLAMEDGESRTDKSLCINICDLSINNMALYDSTFLSYAYEAKKNKAFCELERFTSLTPSVEELTKCNSRFYNKINGIQEETNTSRRQNYSRFDDVIDC